MVYNFNWILHAKGNNTTTEVATAQYIKAKYGTTPVEFAKMIIKKQQARQEEHLLSQNNLTAAEQAAAR
jgi:hypothetical protein